MNAAEVLAALGGRPPTARAEGVVAIATSLPVEVAQINDARDQAMRASWRARSGGRGTPLLVLADQPGTLGRVRVLGPMDDRAAIHELPADRLSEALHGLAGKTRLAATREIAQELQRLDEGGVPGLVVKDLLTRHLLTVRLRTGAHGLR